MNEEKLCACGKPLHYTDPVMRDRVERLIRELGENITVRRDGKSYSVPRHFIALHGIGPTNIGQFEIEAEHG